MTVLVQRLKNDVEKDLFGVSTEVQKTYWNMVDAVKAKILEILDDVWKKMETHLKLSLLD